MASVEVEFRQYLEALSGLEEVDRLAHLFSKATEVAAIVAARTAGFGDKKGSDREAVNAMRAYLNSLAINGIIEVGEGLKDKAPMLYEGEEVGNGEGPMLSIAVDPLEGTDATADLKERASSVLAVSERGGLFRLPKGVFYMDKLIVGPEVRGMVNIDAPVSENIQAIAGALSRDVSDLNIVVLRRSRNERLKDDIRKAGARVRAIEYGDLIPGVLTCARGSGIHAVMGIGGAPEAVLTAAGIKSLGGEIQAKIWAEDEAKQRFFVESGIDTSQVYSQRELVPGEFIVFSATAVTDNGRMLQGVRFFGDGARTNTLLITAIDGKVKVTTSDSTLVIDNTNFQYRFD